MQNSGRTAEDANYAEVIPRVTRMTRDSVNAEGRREGGSGRADAVRARGHPHTHHTFGAKTQRYSRNMVHGLRRGFYRHFCCDGVGDKALLVRQVMQVFLVGGCG